jgi:hypothetical protein
MKLISIAAFLVIKALRLRAKNLFFRHWSLLANH